MFVLSSVLSFKLKFFLLGNLIRLSTVVQKGKVPKKTKSQLKTFKYKKFKIKDANVK